MEAYGGLMALQNGENVYKRLFQLFNKADEKYNSGLFHFSKEKGRENCDSLTPALHIDDKPLKDIFNNLYYPESPYEFSVLSADILGQVYEKFLGKVIRLTAGHQAKIVEKPEVRKAGGVYYTPDYIVDYIVKNTVGKLVEGKKPGPRGGVSHLKILDPACGSGSFLIGAYQFLLDWHRDAYIGDGPENWSKGKTPRIYPSRKGEWRLTSAERNRILLNNIFGVDIDHQAVEVTKLSLLLKVLEGEDEQSIGKQMSLFQERVLPDLSNNIKCGNSLIGPDFYDQQQMTVFDEEEIFRVNAFDWNSEFAEVMKDGGFDAVIGNPPPAAMDEKAAYS
jgi:type I restriction-modification system DNA methylase subunit